MPELHYIVIKKLALKALPKWELSVLLGGGKLLNEINIGTKYLGFSINALEAAQEDSAANNAAAFTVALFFLRILAGHVFEAYQYFRKVIRIDDLRNSNLLDTAFLADVETLQRYFGRTNIISQMRNKFSFHTDVDLLRKSFECVPAETKYDVVLGKYQGHSIFYGSEMIMVAGTQHLKPASDLKAAIHSSFVETTHIAKIISLVFLHIIKFIMTEHLEITMDDAESVTATDGPPIDSVRVPFFCQPPIDRSAK